jgi:hypothetical protein
MLCPLMADFIIITIDEIVATMKEVEGGEGEGGVGATMAEDVETTTNLQTDKVNLLPLLQPRQTHGPPFLLRRKKINHESFAM